MRPSGSPRMGGAEGRSTLGQFLQGQRPTQPGKMLESQEGQESTRRVQEL